MRNCPNCGAPTDATAKFCTECGTALQPGGPGPQHGATRPSGSRQPPAGPEPRGRRDRRPPREQRSETGWGEDRSRRSEPRRGRADRTGGWSQSQTDDNGVSRRGLLAGGGVLALIAGGGWFWFASDFSLGPSVSPGDSFDDAPELSAGEYGTFDLDSGEEHYFAVDLEDGDELTVTMQFEHADGDLDIELYDPSETLITDSMSVTDDETIETTAAENGAHYIRTFPFWGVGNEYDLEVEIN